jgi:hypothetical protein
MRAKEEQKEYFREYYDRHKLEIIERVKRYSKSTNYSSEKTSKQRFLRNIKRQTRRYFILDNHNCEFCGEKATEHHHNTNPIQFDKFNYVCHNCHKLIHRTKKEV